MKADLQRLTDRRRECHAIIAEGGPAMAGRLRKLFAVNDLWELPELLDLARDDAETIADALIPLVDRAVSIIVDYDEACDDIAKQIDELGIKRFICDGDRLAGSVVWNKPADAHGKAFRFLDRNNG